MKIVLFAIQWILTGLGAAALFIVLRAPPGSLSTSGFLNAPASGFAAAVERAAPAVVSIHALGDTAPDPNALTDDPLFREFFGDRSDAQVARQSASLGSGVILDPSGVILTNYHVIRAARAIRVSLADGRAAVARTIGTDPDTDLAVLKIDLDNLPGIPMGDSDRLRVGDAVLAIGNALGIGQTVTQGIVSATGRNRIGINTFENFIQTDAAINFGNSGGALINSRGEFVGVNSVRLESEGIGFAIPTSIALRIARQLLDTGSVERGWIGIDARDMSDSLKRMLATTAGIVVLGVLADGPAAAAGLSAGDVLTAIAKRPIYDSRGAIEYIAAYKPGTRIELSGVRNGEPFTTEVVISRRPLLE